MKLDHEVHEVLQPFQSSGILWSVKIVLRMMNSTQPLNVKNVGMVSGEFMKDQTKKGKPSSYAQLKDKYAPKLLEYANGLAQEASKLEKLTKIRDRLAQLDFEEIQRRQLGLRDDHTTAGKQIEELRMLQEKQTS